MHANRTVSTDHLVDVLWGADPPPHRCRDDPVVCVPTSTARLQPTATRWRSSPRPSGYELVAAAEAIDTLKVTALLRDARAAARNEEHPRVRLSSRRALDLARRCLGRVRHGAVGGGGSKATVRAAARGARAVRRRRARLWSSHFGDRRTRARVSGPNQHRERLWGQLIPRAVPLRAAGRSARAYQRLRHTLADELGLDPVPELQELERRILAQDPRLRGTAPRRPWRRRPATCRFLCRSGTSGPRRSSVGRDELAAPPRALGRRVTREPVQCWSVASRGSARAD